MSDPKQEIYIVNCFVLDEEYPFSVEIARDEVVDILKDEIKAKIPSRFPNIPACFMKLYLVDIPDGYGLVARVGEQKLDNALKAWWTMAEVFGGTPKPNTIHILAKPPRLERKRDDLGPASTDWSSVKEWGPLSSLDLVKIDGTIARRTSTVDALYERLKRYQFVLVRGTRVSGKTTLAQLLKDHICAKEPTVVPILIDYWIRDIGWRTNLTPSFKPDGQNTIIIDDAQLTYWDGAFWNSFLKAIKPGSRNRVVLFASYGNPSGRPLVNVSSMFIPDKERVGLWPVDHGDNIAPAGLLLMQDEFADMVQRRHPRRRFKKDFLDYVYHVTAGHTGAVFDLLEVVLAHKSYRQLRLTKEEYSLETFQSQFPIWELWACLNGTCLFRSGLPTTDELRDEPDTARIFHAVLSNCYVTKKLMDSPADELAFDRCFKSGWLHATRDQEEDRYVFATSLHRWYIEYYLGEKLSDPTSIKDKTLYDFVIQVVQRFSRHQLSSPRNVGASHTQRPPEAQFQDEFYRCSREYSKGSIVSFPEFGGVGRFYISHKKWGIELLGDGHGLEGHSTHFTSLGPYAKMGLADHIILDFRKSQPWKAHPNIPNLYHVVFHDDYKRAYIQFGSTLEKIEEFNLLN